MLPISMIMKRNPCAFLEPNAVLASSRSSKDSKQIVTFSSSLFLSLHSVLALLVLFISLFRWLQQSQLKKERYTLFGLLKAVLLFELTVFKIKG